MSDDAKLGIGAALATFGGAGIILGPFLGLAGLGRPWSFLAGLVVGIAAGAGAALALAGLVARRSAR